MYELRLSCSAEPQEKAGLLRTILMNSGVSEGRLAEVLRRERVFLSVYFDSLNRSKAILDKLYSLRIKGVRVDFLELKDSSWKSAWKKYVRPFNITPEIKIIPAWSRRSYKYIGKREVLLDTTLAFGSGLHATTRMMAELIRARRGSLGEFLDIGTGSGILSVIAQRYGAGGLWALDNDKEAVKTAKVNFSANSCTARYLKALDFGSFNSHKKFDFIAANLLTEDLIKFKGKLISLLCDGGYLAVSGIHQDNVAVLRRDFRDKRIICRKSLSRDNWHAFLFRRKA